MLKDPDVRALMARDGSAPIGSTAEEFGAYFKREIEKYAKVIKAPVGFDYSACRPLICVQAGSADPLR